MRALTPQETNALPLRIPQKKGALSAQYRPDIDGLRAIAVISVILYHYTPYFFPGGFVGVDIFFVISGYLITSILSNSYKNQTLYTAISDFYARRIRRIFPALIPIFISALVCGWLFLFSEEYETLGKHVAASTSFLQNIILWRESNYFGNGAAHTPLLHLWSLAVEEQFYIFWPLILWVIIKRKWPILATISFIITISFAINIWAVFHGYTKSSFYLPITRSWELMIGALLAITHQDPKRSFSHKTSLQAWTGLALIISSFLFINPEENFPGFWALLPAMGSALIINAGPKTFLNNHILSLRPLVWIGLISYPLYLWHWILLSFTTIIFQGSSEIFLFIARLFDIVLSIIFAWLTYRFLEKPIRHGNTWPTVTILVVLMAVLGLSGFIVYKNNGIPNRRDSFVDVQAQKLLNSATRSLKKNECYNLNKDGPNLPRRWYCELGKTNAATWILAYGDSHTFGLLPALDEYGKATNIKIVFSSIPRCLALLNVHVHDDIGPACEDMANRAAKLANQKNKPSAVVLAHRWTAYTGWPGHTAPVWNISNKYFDHNKGHINTRYTTFIDGLNTTLSYYDSLNIPAVLIEDNPSQPGKLPILDFDIRFGIDFNKINKTSIDFLTHQKNQAEVNNILATVTKKYKNASTLNTDEVLCNTVNCPWEINGNFLTIDGEHLSTTGAMLVYPLLRKHLNLVLFKNSASFRD